MDYDKAAEAIIDLINSKPASPSAKEIAAVLRYEAGTHLVSPVGALLGDMGAIHEAAAAAFKAAVSPEHVAAFACFSQDGGPAVSSYEYHSPTGTTARYSYETFAWQSRDRDRVVARVRDLVTQLKSLGVTKIIWRCKPELDRAADGIYRFYARFHVIPYQSLQSLPGFKREGEAMAEA